MRHIRRGFSLAELLVVMGIIALLLAILLPVLSRARQAAHATACLANLQQWGDSFRMYVDANRGRSFPDRADVTDLAWYERLQPHNGDIHRTLLCPEATEPGNAIGSATAGWGPNRTYAQVKPDFVARDVFVGSYGFNSWLYNVSADQQAAAGGDWNKHIDLPAKETDRIPVMGDCIEEWGMPRDTDDVPTDLQHPIPHWSGTGPQPPGPSGSMAYFCINRHRRAINLVFVDGHAQRTELAELWMLKWNNAFTPRQVHIPD